MNKDTGEIVFCRTPFNYDTDAVSNETGTDTGTIGKTQQQFKDEVNINTIVERFGASGERPPTIEFPTVQDFSETFDFQTSMNMIVKARESFMELPAKARARFQNDPQQFLEFMSNHENQEEAIRLKLATRKPPPEKKPEENPPEVKKETDTK